MTAVAAVNAEIGIRGQDDGVGERLGHAHEASIGEAHRHVRVLLNEPHHWLDVLRQIKCNAHGMATKKGTQSGRATQSEKVESLR